MADIGPTPKAPQHKPEPANLPGGLPFFEKRDAVFAPLLVVLFWSTGWYLYTAWTLVDSYYSHGFLVPFISIYFVWKARERLARTPRESSPSGFVWMAASGIAVLLSDFLGFKVLGQLAIIPMLTGLCLVLEGKKRTAVLWFPLAFLIFMVPIPASLTQSVALQIKLFATRCSVALANLFTLPMVQDGSYIAFRDDQLLIGEVCGGLRSLIALLAVGALAAYVSKTRPWARVAIVAMSGPIAVVANVLRIFFLCVVGYYWGSKVAAGTVHDVSGYLIFVVAFIFFFVLEAQLRRWAPARPLSAGPPPAAPAASPSVAGPRASKSGRSTAYATALVLLAVLAAAHLLVSVAQARAARNTPSAAALNIPSQIVDYTQWGADDAVDDLTQRMLETSTILIRNYRAYTGRPLQLTIVYAGNTRRSLHFPEVCLVGSGYEIREQGSTNVSILFSAKRLVLVKGQAQEAVLYWFKTGDAFTGNYFVNTLNWAKNQLTFGAPTSAMIRIATPIGASGQDDAFQCLEDFAVKLAPILRDNIK